MRRAGSIRPGVAVGRPGDELPSGRAIRLYVRNENWQELVDDLAAAANIIVVRADFTPGILWEIEWLGKKGWLAKCAFALVDDEGYPFGRERYQQFAGAIYERCGLVLPTGCWNSWYVRFRAEGPPETFRAESPWNSKELAEKTTALADSYHPSGSNAGPAA